MAASTAAADPSPSALLQRIPVTARAVLELGCGSGALGAAFKAINPSCLYVGVERREAAAAIAASCLDQVLCADAEDPQLALPPLPPLDALILDGVLEHLRDPRALLQRLVTRLSEEGMLLACIPNVQHWSFLENLLHGRWPQTSDATSDAACLRSVLTRDGITQVLRECGLHLLDLHPCSVQQEPAEAFVERLSPALAGLGLERQTLLTAIAPAHYVVRATRRPRAPLQLDALTMQPQVGMIDVRMRQPLLAVTSLGGIGLRLHPHQLTPLPRDYNVPRLLICQRPALRRPAALVQLRTMIERGYVIVVEYDDNPDHFPINAANGYLAFTGVHAVQVSTDPLAASIRRHNPEVAVFRNALDALPPPRPAPPSIGRPLRLFFGALNREADWAPWMETLNAVLLEAPERWAVEVVHDRAFFEALQLPARRFTPTCDYATYRQRLAGCDIAFLPLADTPFNRCKSDLKAVEAAGHGVTSLASPVVYGDSLRDGDTGRLFRTAADLRQILQDWQRDPASVWAMGERARQWVAFSRLQHHQAASREQWYRSLWQRREELTERIYQRVPELRDTNA